MEICGERRACATGDECGLVGIKLVISDAHEGLKAVIVRVLGATWQRCRVHWTRNALAYVPKGQHTMVAAALRQAFQQPDHAAARAALLHVGDKRRADVVGIFPNEESIVRLIGAVLLEANDDWQLQHRYMQIEGMAELNTGPGDDHLLEATPRAA